MATNEIGRRLRVVLDGFVLDEEERTELTVHVADGNGKILHSVSLAKDGTFPLDDRIAGAAATLLIGPADAKPEMPRIFYTVPASDLKRIIAEGVIAIGGRVWQPWFPVRRCVSGNARRCFPFLDVIDGLLVDLQLSALPNVRRLTGNRLIARWPWHRCSPICFGTVEVYRRTCCCEPPVIFDPPFDLDDLPIEVNPDFPPIPPVDPWGPIGPRPGPDPAPFGLRQLVLTGGAIDQRKVQLLRAKAELPKLSGALRREFIIHHPFLWCRCGTPQKVGEGFIQDGGSFQSVGALAYNSGLLNPAANPADAVGQLLDRNLGGNVALQYHFTESMRGVGAVYYRIQAAPADASGDPAGPWTPLASPTWATWRLNTATPGSIALGPHIMGTEANLSKIPYDTGDPLGANEEWQDGQYHGVIPTYEFPNGRYLIMIEVFNAAGARLKPPGAPAAEAGTVAPFTFRRWNVPASTNPVPFAALTHILWWDNRAAVADIIDIRLNGSPSSDQCQFLSGGAGATVQIGYRAYHPQPGSPSFLHNHSLVITRGLNGPSWQVANPGTAEVGEPPAPPHTSVSKTLGDLLGDEPAGRQKCAFAVRLSAHVKTTNGSGTLTDLNRSETAAFAAEIV